MSAGLGLLLGPPERASAKGAVEREDAGPRGGDNDGVMHPAERAVGGEGKVGFDHSNSYEGCARYEG